jgi:hypothetical protein
VIKYNKSSQRYTRYIPPLAQPLAPALLSRPPVRPRAQPLPSPAYPLRPSLAQRQSLHRLRTRPCSQMPLPPHSLHRWRGRPCSHLSPCFLFFAVFFAGTALFLTSLSPPKG